MIVPDLKGVQVVDKPERGRYEDRDVWERSSNIVTYNIYEQSWADLEREGLSHLFVDQADFERRKQARLRPQRKYRAYVIKQGDEVGIGVEQFSEAYTLSIASIYLKQKAGNKDLFHIIAQHVTESLEPGETAFLRIPTEVMRIEYEWTQAYEGTLFVRNKSDNERDFLQTKILAEDALFRKATVTEVFDEAMEYKAEGIEIYVP